MQSAQKRRILQSRAAGLAFSCSDGEGVRPGAWNVDVGKFFEKGLDKPGGMRYTESCLTGVPVLHGGVAQLARAFGSYPKCHRFESSRRYHMTALAVIV